MYRITQDVVVPTTNQFLKFTKDEKYSKLKILRKEFNTRTQIKLIYKIWTEISITCAFRGRWTIRFKVHN